MRKKKLYLDVVTTFREHSRIRTANERLLKKLRLKRSTAIKIGYYNLLDELRKDEKLAEKCRMKS